MFFCLDLSLYVHYVCGHSDKQINLYKSIGTTTLFFLHFIVVSVYVKVIEIFLGSISKQFQAIHNIKRIFPKSEVGDCPSKQHQNQ